MLDVNLDVFQGFCPEVVAFWEAFEFYNFLKYSRLSSRRVFGESMA